MAGRRPLHIGILAAMLAVFALAAMAKSVVLALIGATLLFGWLCAVWTRAQGAMLAVASVFAMLAIAEAALSLVMPSPPPRNIERRMHDPAQEAYIVSDARLGHKPTPGRHRVTLYTPARVPIYDVVYTIGENGFRATKGAVDGAPRVNLFGGSFAMGEGLPDSQIIGARLAEIAGPLDVKTWGVHGYGPHQALALLEGGTGARQPGSDPAVDVLLTFPEHALRVACKPAYAKGSPRYRLASDNGATALVVRDGNCPRLDPLWRQVLGPVINRSRIGQLVSGAIEARERVTEDDLALYQAIVRRFIALAEARGHEPVIGLLPNSLPAEAERLGQIAEAAGATVVDLILFDPAHLTPETEHLMIHPSDAHPSAEGAEEMARRLAAAIKPIIGR